MDILGRNRALAPYLTVEAASLTCQAEDAASLLRDGVIEYSAELYPRLTGSRLFWGPYLALDPGIYLLRFDGRLDGELTVDFAHSGGNIRIKQARVTDLANYLCLALPHPARDFEIRGLRTPGLRALSLAAIVLYRPYVSRPEDGIG